MRYAVLFLVAVLLVPLVQAEDIIKDVRFSGELVTRTAENRTFVPPNREVQAHMQFTVNAPYTQLLLDLSALNTRPRNPLFVNAEQCVNRTCTVPVPLNISASAGQTYRELAIIVVDISSAQEQELFRFSVDTVRPQLVGIGTPQCQRDCSLRSGENTVTVYTNERDSGIDPSTVVLTVDGSTHIPSGCTVNACNFTIPSPASDGSVPVSVNSFTDRAGNIVTGSLSATFTVDNRAPAIGEIRTLPNAPVITGGFELHIVVDDASPVQVTADVTDIIDEAAAGSTSTVQTTEDGRKIIVADCGTRGTCIVPIRPRAGSYEATVQIVVADSAGNSVEAARTFTVARRVAEEGDFWTVELPGGVQPDRLDKGSIKMFKKNFYMPLQLSTGEDARLAYVQPGGCQVTLGDQPVAIRPTDIAVHGVTSNRPVLTFTIPPTNVALDELSGELQVRCAVRTYSLVDGALYDTPEEDTVTGRIRIVSSPLLPDKINELQQQTEEDLQQDLQQLQTLKQIYTLADQLCSTSEDVRNAAAALTMLQMALSVTPGGDGAAVQMMATERALSKAADSLQSGESGAKLCQAISCQDPFGSQQYVNMLTAPGISKETLDKVAGFTTLTNDSAQAFFDPYRSQYIAWATGCVPAIIYHEETKMNIQCEYNACLKNEVPTGLPVSICQDQRSDATCRYVTQGLLNMVPYTAVAGTIRDNFVNVITNPVALAGVGLTYVCDANTDTRLNALCKIPRVVDSASRTHRLYEKVRTAINMVRQNQDGDLCGAPRLPRQDLLDRLPDGYRCGTNHCCVDGWCRVGDDYYKEVSQQEVARREAERGQSSTQEPAVAPDTEELIFRERTGTTIEYDLEDEIPGRIQGDLDNLFETFGMSSETFTDIVGNDPNFYTDVWDNIEQAQLDRAAADTMSAERASLRELQRNVARARGSLTEEQYNQLLQETEKAAALALSEIERAAAYESQIGRNANGDPIDIGRDYDREEDRVASYGDRVQDRNFEISRSAAILKAIGPPPVKPNPIDSEFLAFPGTDDYTTFDPGKFEAAHAAWEAESEAYNEQFREATNTFFSEAEGLYRDAANERRDEAEDREKQNVERIKQAEWEAESARFADPSYRLRQGVRTALQLDRMTSAFGLNKYFGDRYGNRVREVFGQVAPIDAAVGAICDARSDLKENPSVMGYTESGAVGLYLYGVRADPFVADIAVELDEFDEPLPEEEQAYYYTVGGRMLLPPSDAEYEVFLQGGGEPKQLVPKTKLDPAAAASLSWTGNGLLSAESEDAYERVCVRFDRPINELLDVDHDRSELCAPLKVVEDSE